MGICVRRCPYISSLFSMTSTTQRYATLYQFTKLYQSVNFLKEGPCMHCTHYPTLYFPLPGI